MGEMGGAGPGRRPWLHWTVDSNQLDRRQFAVGADTALSGPLKYRECFVAVSVGLPAIAARYRCITGTSGRHRGDRFLLAQHGGALPPGSNARPTPPGLISRRRGVDHGHRRVRRPPQRGPPTLHLDGLGRRHSGKDQTSPAEPFLEVTLLDSDH